MVGNLLNQEQPKYLKKLTMSVNWKHILMKNAVF